MGRVTAHSLAVYGAEVFSVLKSVCIGQHGVGRSLRPLNLDAVLDCEAVATFAAASFDYQSTGYGTHSGAKTGCSFSFAAGSVQGLLCHFDFSRLVTLLLINIHNLLVYHRRVFLAIRFFRFESIATHHKATIRFLAGERDFGWVFTIAILASFMRICRGSATPTRIMEMMRGSLYQIPNFLR